MYKVEGILPDSEGWYFAKLGNEKVVILEVVRISGVLKVSIDRADIRVQNANWHTWEDEAIIQWGPKVEMWDGN